MKRLKNSDFKQAQRNKNKMTEFIAHEEKCHAKKSYH
jgi:hypothetical protein